MQQDAMRLMSIMLHDPDQSNWRQSDQSALMQRETLHCSVKHLELGDDSHYHWCSLAFLKSICNLPKHRPVSKHVKRRRGVQHFCERSRQEAIAAIRAACRCRCSGDETKFARAARFSARKIFPDLQRKALALGSEAGRLRHQCRCDSELYDRDMGSGKQAIRQRCGRSIRGEQ